MCPCPRHHGGCPCRPDERPTKLTIQGEPPIEHGYDADDYLIQAGPLTIVRDAQTGLPDITRAGAIETDLDVNQFVEPERFTAIVAGQPLVGVDAEAAAVTTPTSRPRSRKDPDTWTLFE